MQTCTLPDSSQPQQLQELNESDALATTNDYLWSELLKHLQTSNPKSRKGKRWALWPNFTARMFCVNGPCPYYHCLFSSHSLIVTKGDIMKVRDATRKQFWRRAKSFPHFHVLFRGARNDVHPNQTPIVPQAASSVLFWLSLHCLMTPEPSQSGARNKPRIIMKDDEIFSRPNTQGICTPILQPSTIQEHYLLRVYRALCFTCHLHESLPSALFLTHSALSHARTNMKRNTPSGTFARLCHCWWCWP